MAVSAVFAAYVALFSLAAVACFASLPQVNRIDDADTRSGLAALLATTGLWATASVGYLLAPTETGARAFHTAGLVVGFSTPGAWLYFSSAYTGRTFHRDPRYRRLALAVFLAVAAVKVTNPLHGAYFTTIAVSTPFPHVAVRSEAMHWVTAGLAYAVTSAGYFMLLELFDRTSLDTRPLVALAGLSALPVAATVIGARLPWLVDMSYEPLGVTAFAVGALTVFTGTFESVRATGQVDNPVVFVDGDGDLRHSNDAARRLFPELDGAVGRPLAAVLPEVAAADDGTVVERDVDGDVRSLLVSTNKFAAGRTRVGRLLLFSDVTDSERRRRELERQNERLEQFASAVSHDLRNPLNVAQGRLDLARDGREDDDLAAVDRALDRMEALIADLLTLAQQGEAIGETELCSLCSVAEEAWGNVDTTTAEFRVVDDRTLAADRTRLIQLFENVFRNAIEHAGPGVTVTVSATEDGFFVADDGPGIPADQRERIFEPGVTTSAGGNRIRAHHRREHRQRSRLDDPGHREPVRRRALRGGRRRPRGTRSGND